jgi:hypothetical protein
VATISCPKKRRRHLPATGPGLPTARLVLLRLRSRRGVLGKERLQAPLLGPSRRQTLGGTLPRSAWSVWAEWKGCGGPGWHSLLQPPP